MNVTCPINITCTIQTCPIACGEVTFIPTLPGNVLYAVLLGLILLSQIILGVWYRTWGFMIGMSCGLILEVIGYSGRVLLHYDPFSFNNFLLYVSPTPSYFGPALRFTLLIDKCSYLIPLTIGPAFLSGSIYLCLARLIVAYGTEISRLRPRTYTIIFMSNDFLSLLLQAAGGAIAAVATTRSFGNDGRYIMIAGLAFQVLSLLVFMLLWTDFLFASGKVREEHRAMRFMEMRNRWRFKAFNVGKNLSCSGRMSYMFC
jgi:hypothetical protein